ncbi:MAG: DUF2058 domain-containing protein [Proteobacteria bacterium]|nr:DUF2058 domain-containing protein [Pseudomonadota bacterium]MBU1714883.1 DUF2058 domain-containing protein [Pseudomonadota bacterium]
MGNPFQDKFLKAGLVNKKQVKKIAHEHRISKKQDKNSISTEATSKIEQEIAAQKERNKELNRQHNEEKQQRERLAQVRQMIEQNRLPKDERGEAYNFVEKNKIKKIYVPAEIADQLSYGQAAIVKFGTGYEVVPTKTARQISSRDPETVVVLQEQEEDPSDKI